MVNVQVWPTLPLWLPWPWLSPFSLRSSSVEWYRCWCLSWCLCQAVGFDFDFDLYVDVVDGVYIGFEHPADQKLQIHRPTAAVQSSRCRWVVWLFTRSGTQLRHLGFSSTEKLLGLRWWGPGWLFSFLQQAPTCSGLRRKTKASK